MTISDTTASSASLLPCPFCGSKVAISMLEDDEPGEILSAWVHCSCGIEMHEHRTEEEAVQRWNNRVPAQGIVDSAPSAAAQPAVAAAWGRVIDGKAVTVSLEWTPANDEPLYAAPPQPNAALREEQIEAGAQALADDVWHPPQKLKSLSSVDRNRFMRQARLVLTAALHPSSPSNLQEQLAGGESGEREPTEDEQIVDRINYLRGGEGDSVTILCDNPDFNGQPERAVECCGDWTGWQDRRYVGDTLLAALNAAWFECMQWRTALQYGREKWPPAAALQPEAPTQHQLPCPICGGEAIHAIDILKRTYIYPIDTPAPVSAAVVEALEEICRGPLNTGEIYRRIAQKALTAARNAATQSGE